MNDNDIEQRLEKLLGSAPVVPAPEGLRRAVSADRAPVDERTGRGQPAVAGSAAGPFVARTAGANDFRAGGPGGHFRPGDRPAADRGQPARNAGRVAGHEWPDGANRVALRPSARDRPVRSDGSAERSSHVRRPGRMGARRAQRQVGQAHRVASVRHRRHPWDRRRRGGWLGGLWFRPGHRRRYRQSHCPRVALEGRPNLDTRGSGPGVCNQGRGHGERPRSRWLRSEAGGRRLPEPRACGGLDPQDRRNLGSVHAARRRRRSDGCDRLAWPYRRGGRQDMLAERGRRFTLLSSRP